MRQGVSSGSDEQVGSLSQSTVTQRNTDKDEMEEVVDEEENVDHEEEDVRDDGDILVRISIEPPYSVMRTPLVHLRLRTLLVSS